MSNSTRNTVVMCVSAIVVGSLLWKATEHEGIRKSAGRGLVYFGVNRLLPVLFA